MSSGGEWVHIEGLKLIGNKDHVDKLMLDLGDQQVEAEQVEYQPHTNIYLFTGKKLDGHKMEIIQTTLQQKLMTFMINRHK